MWDRMQARDWDGLTELLATDLVVDWPANGEQIVGRDNFVKFNATYPEGWSIRVLRILGEGDQVVSEVEVPHETLWSYARDVRFSGLAAPIADGPVWPCCSGCGGLSSARWASSSATVRWCSRSYPCPRCSWWVVGSG